MIRRRYDDRDGRCFGTGSHGCEIMTEPSIRCGSYRCPFYKPVGCEDWIKIEDLSCVILVTPEEGYGGE